MVPLSDPFHLGGIGAGVQVTHRGFLCFLPRHLGLCYYAADASATLISLGFLQSQGGSYSTVGRNQLRVLDRDGSVLDIGTMESNRLTTVSPSLLAATSPCSIPRVVPAALLSPTVCFPCSLTSSELRSVLACPSQDAYLACVPQPPLTASAFLNVHINKEQRARCDRVQQLHMLSHVHDDVLCQALDSGTYSWANVTSADVRLNRRLRGPCVQCIQGKMEDKPHPPSDAPPADCVSRLFIDTQQLTSPSPAGNLCYIDSVEEFSGDQQVTPVRSLSSVHIFESLMSLIYARYNAHGHRITHIVSDSLPAMEPVIPMLGAMGIVLTLTPPGQHAHRVERYVGVNAGRRRALLAGLPYDLPAKYSLHARQWVAEVSNGLPNSRSTPSCADIIVTGHRRLPHYKIPDLCFGHVCLVSQFQEKRRDEAHKHAMLVKDVCRAELAVCLGYSRTSPGHFDFLLDNGKIVPRAVVERVNVLPFGWTPHKVLVTELTPPQTFVQGLTQVSDIQQPVQAIPVVLDGSLSDVHVPIPDPPPPVILDMALPPSVPAGLSRRAARPRVRDPDPVSAPVSISVAEFPPPSEPVAPVLADPIVPVIVSVSDVESLVDPTLRRSSRSTKGVWASDRMGYVATPSLELESQLSAYRSLDRVALVARWSATFDTQQPDEVDLDALCARFSVVDSDAVHEFVALAALSPSSSLLPVPSDKCKEVPLRSALRNSPVADLVEATAREINKQRGFGALGADIAESDLPAGAIVVDGHVLYKHKHDGRDTCRIAAMGDRLPVLPSEQTYASVVSDGAKGFVVTVKLAVRSS